MFVGQPKTSTRDDPNPTSRSSQPHGTYAAKSVTSPQLRTTSLPNFSEAVSTVPETATNPAEPTYSTLEKAKDYIGVGWSLAQMLLKKTPDAVDTNPVKIAFGLAKIVLQLKEVRR